MVDFLNALSSWTIPAILVFIPLYAAAKRVPVYESFVDAARWADRFGALPPRGQHAGRLAGERARRC